MLELDRSCPNCGAHARSEADRCSACGKPLVQAFGKPALSLKRKLAYALGAVLFLAATGYWAVRPSLTKLPILKGGAPRWTRDGASPPARAWAWKLEQSLEEGCASAFNDFTNKKTLEPSLNYQLIGGTLESAKKAYEEARRTSSPIPKVAPDEVADAAASVGSIDAFISACVVRAYAAVEPCEKLKDVLGTKEASACLVPPVQRVLAASAWRACTNNAHLPRVKTLCRVVAERSESAPPAPAATTGM
jgi:hypothetical protein